MALAFVAPAFAINKVAVVNVQKVVNKSAQVQILKKDQEAKAKELTQFVQKANAEIQAQTDDAKKKALVKKYEKELATKREANAKAYQSRLEAIDKSISGIITNYAKANGYDLILNKGSVLYGGVDVTEELLKIVK